MDSWVSHPIQDEWCLTEILCHLRDVEKEVNIQRFEKVLTEENPFIAGRDTDQWAQERRYIEQDGRLALDQFTAARVKILEKLENLTDECVGFASQAYHLWSYTIGRISQHSCGSRSITCSASTPIAKITAIPISLILNFAPPMGDKGVNTLSCHPFLFSLA